MNNNSGKTKRVAVVVSKQQKKQVKSTTRKGPAKGGNSKKEVIYAPLAMTQVSSTKNMKSKNQFIFHRREFLKTIAGSTSEFEVKKSLILNPGEPETFQWLSNVARCFESYRFRRLKFCYVPRCASTTPGWVSLSPDMNPEDLPPLDDQQAFANEKSKTCSPWGAFEIVISPEMLHKRSSYFCRPLAKGDSPIDLYDIGNLHIICGGNGVTSNIGHLWAEYEIEFMTPEGFTQTGKSLLTGGGAVDGVSLTNPIPNAQAKRVVTGDFIKTITNDGTRSVVEFAKDFHGILNGSFTGTGFTFPPVTLTNLADITLNETEAFWNGNQNFANAAQTIASVTNLISAKAGGRLGVNLVGTGVTNSAFSLEECNI